MRGVAYGKPVYLKVPRSIVCASGILYLRKPEVLIMILLIKSLCRESVAVLKQNVYNVDTRLYT